MIKGARNSLNRRMMRGNSNEKHKTFVYKRYEFHKSHDDLHMFRPTVPSFEPHCAE